MNINGTGHTRGGIQSIDRAVTVLQYLAYNGSGSVTEVSHELDVHKSTAFRILNTLVGRGLVEQHGETGEYSLEIGRASSRGSVQASGGARVRLTNSAWLRDR